MSFLLDTNVVSEARKPSGDANVQAWFVSVPGDALNLSALVIGEIRRGIEHQRLRDTAQAAVYEAWLATLVGEFADRIIPVDAAIAEEWGRMNVPDPIPTIDGLMAATAKVRGFTLVTRDVRDVARTGVRVLNPFDPTSHAT